jgi:hypothetical protein
MFAFRGVALLVSGETPVRIDPENGDLLQMGRAALGPVPFPVVLLVLVYLALGWAARYTRLGRVVHAVGGNSSGAEMMGLPVARAKGSVYVLSGVLASIGGILLASRLGSGQPVAGEMYDLSAIAAVVIGGTLLSGGVGRLSGTFAGVVLIAMIANVFNLQGDLSTWWARRRSPDERAPSSTASRARDWSVAGGGPRCPPGTTREKQWRRACRNCERRSAARAGGASTLPTPSWVSRVTSASTTTSFAHPTATGCTSRGASTTRSP